MSSREKILDAYEAILIADGERAATLNAVARAAEVSKGGLLYHFKDKQALAHGLLERYETFSAQDVRAMEQAPDGASAYYVRTSVYQGTGMDRTTIACLRLGQDMHPLAQAAMERTHQQWLELIEREVGDAAVARAILLLGDGLYYNAALAAGGGHGGTEGTAVPDDAEHLDALLDVVRRLKAQTQIPA